MTLPGEGLLIKLWETLAEKGVGGLLSPWQIKREAKAHTEARRIEIVALADAERTCDVSGRLTLGDTGEDAGLARRQRRLVSGVGREPVLARQHALVADVVAVYAMQVAQPGIQGFRS